MYHLQYAIITPPATHVLSFKCCARRMRADNRERTPKNHWSGSIFLSLAARVPGNLESLQPCLASIDRLKLSNSRYPNFLFLPRPFQAIHEIFRLFSLCPHQNFPNKEFISRHKVVGSRNTLIVYVGIAWRTDLIRTSFPTCDNNFSFQPFIRFQILLLRLLKVAGKPRYVS